MKVGSWFVRKTLYPFAYEERYSLPYFSPTCPSHVPSSSIKIPDEPYTMIKNLLPDYIYPFFMDTIIDLCPVNFTLLNLGFQTTVRLCELRNSGPSPLFPCHPWQTGLLIGVNAIQKRLSF